MLAHQTELKDLLQQLYNKNSTIDIIVLSETFPTKKTEKLVNIPGYQLLSNSQIEHKGEGVCFLLKNGIRVKWREDLETFIEKEIETLYIEINTKCGKKIVLGSLYQAPNTNSSNFIKQLQTVIDTVKNEKDDKELILCMDHNMDLLKCGVHKATKEFLKGLVDRQIMPTITCPTRIMQTSTTMIDNIFVSGKLH